MNQTQLAKALGISRQAVSKLKAQGMPVGSLRAAQKWRSENLDMARSAAMLASAAERAPLLEALRRRMASEASMAELKYRRERDKLISVAAMKRELLALHERLTVGADELIRSVAPRVAGLSDALAIHDLLDTEIRSFLEREAAR